MTFLLRHLAFHLSTTWAAVTTNTAPPRPDIGNPPEHWAQPNAANEAFTAHRPRRRGGAVTFLLRRLAFHLFTAWAACWLYKEPNAMNDAFTAPTATNASFIAPTPGEEHP